MFYHSRTFGHIFSSSNRDTADHEMPGSQRFLGAHIIWQRGEREKSASLSHLRAEIASNIGKFQCNLS